MSNSPELFAGSLSGQFSDLLMDHDDESEILFKEEMIEEVMQELYKEISYPSASLDATNVSRVYGFPVTETSLEVGYPSFLVDKGKNGSCGAAVSDLESTMMAGIELVGHSGKMAGGKFRLSENGFGLGEGGCTGVDDQDDFGEMMDGCDGVEFDDEWLERVLSWGPLDDEFDVGPK